MLKAAYVAHVFAAQGPEIEHTSLRNRPGSRPRSGKAAWLGSMPAAAASAFTLRRPALDKPGGGFDDGQPEAIARHTSSALPTPSISCAEHVHGHH